MSRRAKLSLPQHIRLQMNPRTGYYEGVEDGIVYQLNFLQLNDFKVYHQSLNGLSVATLKGWYNNLSAFSRKRVKIISGEVPENDFYPDE